MKRQNNTNSLAFNKMAVAELNDSALIAINGGSTIVGGETCSGCCCDPITTKVSLVRTIEAAEF